MVTLIDPEAHDIVCIVGDRVEGRCIKLFPGYWTESQFLMGNDKHVYKKEDLDL